MTDGRSDDIQDSPTIVPSAAALSVARSLLGAGSDGLRATALDVWGGLIGDRVREWRQRNLIAVLEKTAELLKQKGVALEDAKSLPNGSLYVIFEGASKSEPDGLRELWAFLLTSAVIESDPDSRTTQIANLLSQLSPRSAKLLFLMVDFEKRTQEFSEFDKGERELMLERLRSGAMQQKEVSSVRKKIDEAVKDFVEDLLERINDAGLIDPREMEKAKLELLKHALITPKVGGRQRRFLPTRVRLDGRALERYLEGTLNQIVAGQSVFEEWASRRLVAADAPAIEVKAPNKAAVNFQLTELGSEFSAFVGILE